MPQKISTESSDRLSHDEARLIIKAIEQVEKEEAAEQERARQTGSDTDAG